MFSDEAIDPSSAPVTLTEALDPSRCAPDRDVVAVDTETTGLPWYERLIEIGAVRFRGARVIDRWRMLVDPRRPIPARVTEIHGITDALVAGAPEARVALLELQRFCRGALLIAHNASFDRDILAAEYARAGLTPPPEPLYCTWRFAKHCITDAPRYGLTPLAAHLGLPAAEHRALPDAELARRVFLAACERLTEPCTVATLDAYATGSGAALSLRGAVRRARDLPPHLRPLRGARAKGAVVALTVRGAEGEAERVVCGVPRALLARGDDGAVDVWGDAGLLESVPFAAIAGVAVG